MISHNTIRVLSWYVFSCPFWGMLQSGWFQCPVYIYSQVYRHITLCGCSGQIQALRVDLGFKSRYIPGSCFAFLLFFLFFSKSPYKRVDLEFSWGKLLTNRGSMSKHLIQSLGYYEWIPFFFLAWHQSALALEINWDEHYAKKKYAQMQAHTCIHTGTYLQADACGHAKHAHTHTQTEEDVHQEFSVSAGMHSFCVHMRVCQHLGVFKVVLCI